MRYHSNFTVQPQYLNWVRLSRKFICISISSLAGEVWAEATSWWLSTYAVPRMADGHWWEAKLIGAVPIIEYVIERLWLIIRILRMMIQGYPWRMYRILWWKCTTSAECQTIRIAVSAVMDSWSGHTVPLSDVFKMTYEMNDGSWLDHNRVVTMTLASQLKWF